MHSLLKNWLLSHQFPFSDAAAGILLFIIFSVGIMIFSRFLRKIIVRPIKKNFSTSKNLFLVSLSRNYVFARFILIVEGFLLIFFSKIWLIDEQFQYIVTVFFRLWITIAILLSVLEMINLAVDYIKLKGKNKTLPIKGLSQTLKLICWITTIIILISILVDRSPVFLLSSIGALSAVILLVFKDPIMGLAAGIQLSANKMLQIGDWLQVESPNVNGEVLEIGLTTVKVKNWDNTITLLPTYSLITSPFINWQGMIESGGRRINKNVTLDVNSIRYLTESELDNLESIPQLNLFIKEQRKMFAKNRHELNIFDGQISNLTLFRRYLALYIDKHPKIEHNMFSMVRLLETNSNGVPVQIYAFCNDVTWLNFEMVQSELFEYIYAVIPLFQLRLFQQPSGLDWHQGITGEKNI